jgi:transcription initiation factor TFIIIB Brf1 subunit/transcription initiation factor TFIIB
METEPDTDATDRIRSIAERVGFDDSIGDLATQVFTNAVEEGVVTAVVDRDESGRFEGETRNYPAAAYPAAVYAAARIRDIPTKPSEVADAADVDADVDAVGDYYKDMLGALPYTVEPEDPVDWVRRLCDDLDVSPGFETDAVDLCGDAVGANLHNGKAVSGFAAAVVYATSEYRDADVGQDRIAEVADVSPVTIRNQYRDVLELWERAAEPGDPDVIRAAVNDVCDRIDGLPSRVRADVADLAADAIDADADFVSNTDPDGVAAGIVYVAAKDARVDVSQTEVADVAGVSKSTVVNRVNDVRDWRRRKDFEAKEYNTLKQIAADHGVDVGQQPERPYLIDRLVEAGVDA